MKKKSLFYLASTAILIAASSQQIFADESVKTSTLEPTVEVNKQEAHSSAELQTKEVTQTAPIKQLHLLHLKTKQLLLQLLQLRLKFQKNNQL